VDPPEVVNLRVAQHLSLIGLSGRNRGRSSGSTGGSEANGVDAEAHCGEKHGRSGFERRRVGAGQDQAALGSSQQIA
jgi:hypothetical protein